MKIGQLTLLLTFLCAIVNAGAIKGKVTLGNDSTTLSGVSIHLLDKKLRFSTDENGMFIIPNLTKGIHTLEISYAGFKKEIIQEIEITDDYSTKELTVNLHETPFLLGEIVVTGTRTAKQLADVPIPTSVVSQKEISARNAVRLDDILSEQTGLSTVAFLGTGIQLQGLDPDYTLILLDGEPIIGRRGGTLDLKRINVGNVKQIEIVKGPTSALYGSDALAGVVNIITERPQEPLSGKLSLRYGTHNTADLSATFESKLENLGATVLLQRSSSDGYDFEPTTPSTTAPSYTSYTVAPNLTYSMDSNIDLQLSGRIYFEEQEDPTVELASLTDWSLSPKLTYRFAPETKLMLKGYSARYKKAEDFYVDSIKSFADRELFDQTISKAETEFTSAIKTSFIVTAGAGYMYETVEADRIANGKQDATSVFAYAQNEWIPCPWFDFVASYRFDSHSDYAVRFSPKVSMMLRPIDQITIRSSYGSGFKAPTFQQLYLDFTNPAAGGYMVFGVVGFVDRLNREVNRGNVVAILRDPKSIQTIRPEYSTAYNVGIDIEPIPELLIKMNAFYNDIEDLIDAVAVATTSNGSSVFSYMNLNKVFTRGFESEVKYSPIEGITLSAGYQYLEAKDKQVVEDVKAGKIYKPTPNGSRKVKESEYGGLLNRSKHSGNLKILYDYEATGTLFNLSFIFRDRYGYADLNGNLILDDKTEYVKGYALINISVMQIVWNTLAIHGSIDNLFDRTNPELIPSISGRIIYCGLSYQFK
ncbi:MAG: TonB-dependent receptor [Bacteroidota bacterium]